MELVRIIRRKRPRIVQGWLYHGNPAATVATWASGVRPRPPVGWAFSTPFRISPAIRHGCAAPSGSVQSCPVYRLDLYNSRIALDAHQQFGFRSRQTHLGSNGIDLNKFRFDPISRAAVRRSWGLPDDAVVVIVVGRNDPMKTGRMLGYRCGRRSQHLAGCCRRGYGALAAELATSSARTPRRYACTIFGSGNLHARFVFRRRYVGGIERGDGVRLARYRH